MKQAPDHYSTGSMLFHWGIAVLVFGVGLTSPLLDHRTWPALSAFHNLGGSLVLVLGVSWFAWRAQQQKLPNLDEITPREQQIMSMANRAIDVLLILAPLSGLVYLFALGGTLDVGLIKLHPAIEASANGVRWLGITHHVLGALLVIISGVHALHAVWHHVHLKDGLLARMLPWH
jgi:cytochrome b561